MAKAKVVKSKRGRDLVRLTVGPREAGKLLALLNTAPLDTHLAGISAELGNAQGATANAKYFEIRGRDLVQLYDYD